MRFFTFFVTVFMSLWTGSSSYAEHGGPHTSSSSNERATARPVQTMEDYLREERELLAWQTRAFKLQAMEFKSLAEAREFLTKKIGEKSVSIHRRNPEIQPDYQSFIDELDDFRALLPSGQVNYPARARDFIAILKDAVLANSPAITESELKERIEDSSRSRYVGVNGTLHREITRQLAAGPVLNNGRGTDIGPPGGQTRGSGEPPRNPQLPSMAAAAPKPIPPSIAASAPVAVSPPAKTSPSPLVPAGNQLLEGTAVSIPKGLFSTGATFQLEGGRFLVLPDGSYRRIGLNL